MVSTRMAWQYILLFLLVMPAWLAHGQPTLPAISGHAEKGLVVLNWNCQYNGVKEITVLRSADSAANYSIIGNVKKLDKGLQVFVDGHPALGKNYYKLTIVFKSGLKWGSDFCHVEMDQRQLAEAMQQLPSNDSLQRLIVTREVVDKPLHKVSESTRQNKQGAESKPGTTPQKATPIAQEKSPRISVTFDPDTTNISTKPIVNIPKPPDHKIKIDITFDDPALSPPTFIKPLYLFTDPVTGNININLPDNAARHHYTLKFYDMGDHIVIDVPKLAAAKIIMDKRNFQKKGVYKFVLRKDGLELESGYMNIN